MSLGMVAFYTFLERKVLGFSQNRIGPNKLMFTGFGQPVMDGMKLLMKNSLTPLFVQVVYFISCVLVFLVFLMVFLFSPWKYSANIVRISFLLVFTMIGIGTYTVILMGWSITSSFSKLGSLRAMLQGLSFEVALVMSFFLVLLMFSSLSMLSFLSAYELMFIWVVSWLVLCLMESNRAPFDLLEGESELISGFNLEMGGLMFVFIFLSEYGMLFMLVMFTMVPFKGSLNFEGVIISSLMLLIRGCYPRVRYDYLMLLMWQFMLPFMILLLMGLSLS
uniref:NADH-ubiquinone oxidoreductase chain 1 n=1 Tax=Xiphinema pachtaicum TaxID=260251 RepID=A0A1P8C787_9BILA|nr:NADH dehydrogenase subunit 1 [Xiphinema pachtaicum]AOT84268.1 NADH dehydrogenase subunit 1 [Xiphinema pachtaicum]